MQGVVLDTNILVSAALWPTSVPAQALQIAVARMNWVCSDESVQELQAVLLRPKFERWAPATLRQSFVDFVRRHAEPTLVLPEQLAVARGVCRDPDDALFLALALAADARWLVSGDEDLLTLQHWQGVRIVDAAQFVREINTLMRDGPFFT